ncbi:hypothetical protein NL676_020661 [Syzygium grande]|nr:hypothetical protein NL676_020661 [Syzygium grande]
MRWWWTGRWPARFGSPGLFTSKEQICNPSNALVLAKEHFGSLPLTNAKKPGVQWHRRRSLHAEERTAAMADALGVGFVSSNEEFNFIGRFREQGQVRYENSD